MSNDIFDVVFDRELRWPRKGDQPFSQSENPNENAELEERPHGRLVMMVAGYKLAADLMVERSHDRFDRATLVYPIIFNYRHFIELSLKYIIATYGHTVEVDANWETHDLEKLWRIFSNVLRGYGLEDPEMADAAVAEIVAEFARVDRSSFSFRYPVDRNGKKIPLTYEELDLKGLADAMRGVDGYIKGCDGYLDSLQSAGP